MWLYTISQLREGEAVNQVPRITVQAENVGMIFGQILPLPFMH
jgi:hypothetical protein